MIYEIIICSCNCIIYISSGIKNIFSYMKNCSAEFVFAMINFVSYLNKINADITKIDASLVK